MPEEIYPPNVATKSHRGKRRRSSAASDASSDDDHDAHSVCSDGEREDVHPAVVLVESCLKHIGLGKLCASDDFEVSYCPQIPVALRRPPATRLALIATADFHTGAKQLAAPWACGSQHSSARGIPHCAGPWRPFSGRWLWRWCCLRDDQSHDWLLLPGNRDRAFPLHAGCMLTGAPALRTAVEGRRS